MSRGKVLGEGRLWLRAGVALLAAASLTAACGDDADDSDATAGAGGDTPVAGAAPDGGTDSVGQGGTDAGRGGTTSPGGTDGEGGTSGSEPSSAGAPTAGVGNEAGAGGGGPESPFDCSPRTGAQQLLQLTELSADFEQPVSVAQPSGETERLFVVELGGLIRILQGTTIRPEPFLDLSDLVDFTAPERGLVALAFHPRFAENGRFFVVYNADTATPNGALQLSEFHVSTAPDHADPTEKPLLSIEQPGPNHIGRALAFGPDGNLYWATGDGGGSADEQLRGQLATGLLGKIVRIDVDSAPAAQKAYAIPAGNMAGGAPERWAFGLRFPLGLSFDACTGDMYLGDTNLERDEINFAPAAEGGQNYGWSMYDGTQCLHAPCSQAGKTFPVYETADSFHLHGGFVYRGSALPSFRGFYFAVDRAEGVALAFELIQGVPNTRSLSLDLGPTANGTQGIGQDSRGELYLANLSGSVYRIDPEP